MTTGTKPAYTPQACRHGWTQQGWAVVISSCEQQMRYQGGPAGLMGGA
jgi:hypothetical protein